jgi:type I restriction enzyme, S subunit
MSDWPTVMLKEAGVTLIDCDHKTPKAQEKGFPYVGIPQLKEGRITLDGVRLITEEDFHHWRRKAKPTPNDVILSRRCNPGETAYVPEGLEIALGQNLVLLRSDGKKLYPPFLRWVVHGTNWWNQVSKFINVGAVFDSLKCADMPNFEIQLPPMGAQLKIAEVLGAFDKKIELNRQINQTLEQIAQAIFKSWFVDFEPVKAKIEAKQNGQDPERAAMCAISGKTDEQLDQLSPEQRQQLATTAALFSDELEDSELGEISAGWEVTSLGAITSELRRGVSPKYVEEGGVQVINQKCIRNHTIDFAFCKRNDPSKKKIDGRELRVGDVLVNSTGVGTLGRLAPVRYLPEITVADSHVTLVRGIAGEIMPAFLSGFMLSKEAFIESSGAGSTGQTELNRQVLGEIRLCKPSYQVQEEFERIISPAHKLIAQNEQQVFALLASRDALLPKLLSGEINLGETQSTDEAMA